MWLLHAHLRLLLALFLALAVLPVPALAENITLPSKTFALGTWEKPFDFWYYGYGSSSYTAHNPPAYYERENYYKTNFQIYYRLLKGPSGEQLIDEWIVNDHVAMSSTPQAPVRTNSYSYRTQSPTIYSAEFVLPAKTVDLTKPGDYVIELRHVTVPLLTFEKYSAVHWDSVVDLWSGKDASTYNFDFKGRTWSVLQQTVCADISTGNDSTVLTKITTVKGSTDLRGYVYDSCENHGMIPAQTLGCHFSYQTTTRTDSSTGSITNERYDACFIDQITQPSVSLRDKSELIEAYSISVAGSSLEQPEQPSIAVSADNPFNPNTGTSEQFNNSQAGMALAGILGVAALGSGAYLFSRYSTGSGSTFSIFRTSVADNADQAVIDQRSYIEQKKREYEAWLKELEELKRKNAAIAAFAPLKKRAALAKKAMEKKIASFQADLAAVNKEQSLGVKSKMLETIEKKYSDILTDGGKEQLSSASVSYMALAQQQSAAAFAQQSVTKEVYAVPFKPAASLQPAKQESFFGNLWNGFTGALSGLGKAIGLGMKKDKAIIDMELVADTIKDNWMGIAAGVGLGMLLVATSEITVPAVAAYFQVTTAAVNAGILIAGAAATFGYVAITYGSLLNKVNENCSSTACRDNDKSLKELKKQGLVDSIVITASVGLGKLFSRPVAASAFRLNLPVEGLTDSAAVETYNIVIDSLAKTGDYARFKKIVIVGGDTLGSTRAAVYDDVLYANKDMLAYWKKYPDTAIPHETGHQALRKGLAKATPEALERELAGTETSGPIIEVVADKNAFLLGGDPYAAEWMSTREWLFKEYAANPQMKDMESIDKVAWLYTVSKNTGNEKAANALMKVVTKSNPEAVNEFLSNRISNFQSVWDTTSIAKAPSEMGALGGLYAAKLDN